MTTTIESPAAWVGSELAKTTEWIHHLTKAEIEDIRRVVTAVQASSKPRDQLTRADVAFDALAPAIGSWRRALAQGRGFVLVCGLPVGEMTHEEAVTAYWAIGLHLGSPVPQNFQGELLTDIRDTGADPTDPSTRLYKTRVEQDFHTDGADIIGLLCRAARSGAARAASSARSPSSTRSRAASPRSPRSSSVTSTGTTSSRTCPLPCTSPVRSVASRRAA